VLSGFWCSFQVGTQTGQVLACRHSGASASALIEDYRLLDRILVWTRDARFRDG